MEKTNVIIRTSGDANEKLREVAGQLRDVSATIEQARIAALEAENATLRAALNTAEGTVEGCRNMLVEYGVGRAYGVDFRQELTTLLASIRAVVAGEGGA